MQAIEVLEWRLEEVLVRDRRRIRTGTLMALMRGLPLTQADMDYIASGGQRVDRLIDRCFELMGESRSYDFAHDSRVGEP